MHGFRTSSQSRKFTYSCQLSVGARGRLQTKGCWPLPGCLFHPLRYQPVLKATQDRHALGTFRDGYTGHSRWIFRPPTPPYTQPCQIIGRQTGLTMGRKQNQHKVSKCQNIDKEILFRNSIAVCLIKRHGLWAEGAQRLVQI